MVALRKLAPFLEISVGSLLYWVFWDGASKFLVWQLIRPPTWRGMAGAMEACPVSKAVSHAGNEGAELIAPA